MILNLEHGILVPSLQSVGRHKIGKSAHQLQDTTTYDLLWVFMMSFVLFRTFNHALWKNFQMLYCLWE